MRIDPLIKEANRRKRRRRFLLSLALLGAVALAASLTVALRPSGKEASGAWLPPGVQEIDVHSGPGSPPVHVTDSADVARIVGWFDALVRAPRRERMSTGEWAGCAGGYPEAVIFTFRGANGSELAIADSTADPAWYCGAIWFTAGDRPRAFLVDRPMVGREAVPFTRHERAGSFVGRVQRLLGVKFHPAAYVRYSR